MDKRNKILALLLAVQIIIIIFVYAGGADYSKPQIELLSGLGNEKINKLVITDDEEQSATLVKGEDGWFLDRAETPADEEKEGRIIKSTDVFHYPVDQEKANTLAEKLAGLQSTRLVTRTASSHDRLQVGEESFSRKIEISTAGGAAEKIFLGVAPNYKTIHVRMDDDENVYLVKDLALWEAPADAVSWWPNQYVKFSVDAMQKVDLKNDNGSFSLEKDKEGKWRLAGNAADLKDETLTEFIDRIKEISLVDFVTDGKQKKLGKPAAVLTVHTPEKQINITIWPKDEETSDHVVKSSDSALYARVGAYEVEHLLQKKKMDFLVSNP
jgi:hypothetical protein